ncbi:hypothetical protein ACFQ6U_12495 [Streptomyces sp. NPDC056465]|uniref:hypothetical protein n=1 Tax=Streptomyces sp. NPDC056465 TaxID=3345829 RepID=UPI0036BF7C77
MTSPHFLDAAIANTSGRNTAFLVGPMLCCRRLTGLQVAAIAPVAWVITMMLIGNSGGNGRAQPWSVALMPPDHLPAALAAVAMPAVGTAWAPATPVLRDAS